jgi:hypothetical protein
LIIWDYPIYWDVERNKHEKKIKRRIPAGWQQATGDPGQSCYVPEGPEVGLQADKKFFLLEKVGLTTLEYLEA